MCLVSVPHHTVDAFGKLSNDNGCLDPNMKTLYESEEYMTMLQVKMSKQPRYIRHKANLYNN